MCSVPRACVRIQEMLIYLFVAIGHGQGRGAAAAAAAAQHANGVFGTAMSRARACFMYSLSQSLLAGEGRCLGHNMLYADNQKRSASSASASTQTPNRRLPRRCTTADELCACFLRFISWTRGLVELLYDYDGRSKMPRERERGVYVLSVFVFAASAKHFRV